MKKWHRFWKITEWINNDHFGHQLLFSLPTQYTHLRTFVSWYIEGWPTFNLAEPMFVGVEALKTTEPPGDPATVGLGADSDWWRGEVHYGQQLAPGPGATTTRTVWPAGGSRLWDIETNRRPLGNEQLHYWFVWSGPADVLFGMRAVLYWATLIDDHDIPTLGSPV